MKRISLLGSTTVLETLELPIPSLTEHHATRQPLTSPIYHSQSTFTSLTRHERKRESDRDERDINTQYNTLNNSIVENSKNLLI